MVSVIDGYVKSKCPRIPTVDGFADYLRTEVEDVSGKWDDGYQTGMGDYVIHAGTEHHVYRVWSVFEERIDPSVMDEMRRQIGAADRKYRHLGANE